MNRKGIQAPESNSASPNSDRAVGRTPQITHEVARKVLTTVDAGLIAGFGEPIPGEMSIGAAVCYALGLPHGHEPRGVARSLRIFSARLNEFSWSSPKVRAKGLRRLALAQLDSMDVLDEREFVAQAARLVATKYLPAALRAVASVHQDPKHQTALIDAARCERRAMWASCIWAQHVAHAAAKVQVDPALAAGACALDAANAVSAANAANHHLEGDDINDPHDETCDDLTDNVDDVADGTGDEISIERAAMAGTIAARDVAWAAVQAGRNAEVIEAAVVYATSAARNAAWTAAQARHNAEAYDRVLAEFAEDIVQVLVSMRAPGCEWLDLTKPV